MMSERRFQEYLRNEINRLQHTRNDLQKRMRILALSENEYFTTASYDIRLEENSKVAIHTGKQMFHNTVLAENSYLSGTHRLRIKIENLNSNHKYLFFGVLSSSIDNIQSVPSFYSPSAYGWSMKYIYVKGIQIGEYDSDIIQEDVIELELNCDERIISLLNKRTNKKMQMMADGKLPWKLHCTICCPGDCLRLLD
ncbi:unnamed protein product [Didymodactylos carnosus]|uniref:Uncharacterized protein n=1 Tax=Didymodactylos carnosus TaxID=1234261 RepID=A0A813SUL2_9BILA|nr:unnamed protein product [Didymodactylos carnosus]CAF0799386.1 unnamed protein product [Didymodactylos carnosus]CAF0799449.1 unnamed protein product [Didymodactylos carnosus]CAF3542114.1 unnamed protein product [Didymodactylos carnosus]CAF3584292.1 unnamed protein product [Didymodactylos carnosus]